MTSYLIGVDIGTESGRAVLFNQNGKVVSSSSYNYPVYYPGKGKAEQNPEDWWQATIVNIKNVITGADIDTEKISGIGVCGQMHAAVPIDSKGNVLLEKVPIWCDKRSRIDDLKNTGLKNITANTVNPTWTGFKIRWFKENHPELYKNTYKFLACKDYINYMLTGEIYTDYSDASGTYLLDIHKNDWSEKVINMLNIDSKRLPSIRRSNCIIGTVKKNLLNDLGINKNRDIKVVCGGGDMMCLLLGAGMVEEGIGCDVTGTAADVSCCSREPLLDERIMNLHHVVEDYWVPYGILDSGGGSLQWFKNNFGKIEEKKAEKENISVYEIFSQQASSVKPGSNGLIFLPYLMGERNLGSVNSRGVFFGMDSTHNKKHLIRAIMEGVTYDLKQSLDIIKEELNLLELRVIGGGANSDVWLNIKANIYNIPILTLDNFEGGAIGAAILAGVGTKVFTDEKEAVEKMINIENKIYPAQEEIKLYDKYYKLFKLLHDDFQEYYRKLAKLTN